mgnify:CR=1 FL=1
MIAFFEVDDIIHKKRTFGENLMLLTFSVILFGALILIRPLQRNPFYILNSALIIGIAWVLENYYFRTSFFSYKTILLLVVFQLITINFTTFLAYFVDKRAAIRGAYRIPESQLHTLELVGGTLGAMLGQKLLRHKSRKKEYRVIFRAIVVMQIVAVLAILRFLHFI